MNETYPRCSVWIHEKNAWGGHRCRRRAVEGSHPYRCTQHEHRIPRMNGTMSHIEALKAIGYAPTVSWVCMVVRSGYHNGAHCSPSESHDGWRCGYRVELSIPITPTEAAVDR